MYETLSIRMIGTSTCWHAKPSCSFTLHVVRRFSHETPVTMSWKQAVFAKV